MPHFPGEWLALSQNIEFKPLPFRGSVPGVTDAVGGQIASMLTPAGDFLFKRRAGGLRLLAASGRARQPAAGAPHSNAGGRRSNAQV